MINEDSASSVDSQVDFDGRDIQREIGDDVCDLLAFDYYGAVHESHHPSFLVKHEFGVYHGNASSKQARGTNSVRPSEYTDAVSVHISYGASSEDGDDETLSECNEWRTLSEECLVAQSDIMSAREAYDEATVLIEQQRTEALQKEKNQMEEVRKLEDAVLTCGVGIEETEKRSSFEELLRKENERLGEIRAVNVTLLDELERLEAQLASDIAEKEKIYHTMFLSEVEKELRNLKTEAQEHRRVAIECNESVALAREAAQNAPDREALDLWDNVLELAKQAETLWMKAYATFQTGASKASTSAVSDEGWWTRASESVKNSLYTKRVACLWYVAKKAECAALIAESDAACIMTTSPNHPEHAQELWSLALQRARETLDAWHAVPEAFRNYVDVVNEVFEGWWVHKLQLSVEIEAFWMEIVESMQEFIEAKYRPTLTAASEIFEFRNSTMANTLARDTLSNNIAARASASNGTQGSDYAEKISSFKSLRFSANLDDWVETRSTTTKEKRSSLSPRDQQQARVQQTVTTAFEERQRIRRSCSTKLNPLMRARQEEALRICFAPADEARAELVHHFKDHGRGVTLWYKIAAGLTVSQRAIKCYTDLVRQEALADAARSRTASASSSEGDTDATSDTNQMEGQGLTSRMLRADWEKRVELDAEMVEQTRIRAANSAAVASSSKNSPEQIIERTRTQRDYIRAKAILKADQQALRAAWPPNNNNNNNNKRK